MIPTLWLEPYSTSLAVAIFISTQSVTLSASPRPQTTPSTPYIRIREGWERESRSQPSRTLHTIRTNHNRAHSYDPSNGVFRVPDVPVPGSLPNSCTAPLSASGCAYPTVYGQSPPLLSKNWSISSTTMNYETTKYLQRDLLAGTSYFPTATPSSTRSSVFTHNNPACSVQLDTPSTSCPTASSDPVSPRPW